LGTGTIRGVYYNPSVGNINGSNHIAWQNTSGSIIHGNLTGSGTRMVVADSTGKLDTQGIPPVIVNINSQSGTTYTLALTDAYTMVDMTSGSPNTLTVPDNGTVAFPIGSQITIVNSGVGQTTVAAGAGVTIGSVNGKLKLASRYSAATLTKVATNTWYLIGDLTA
jgi:hypothetical protein